MRKRLLVWSLRALVLVFALLLWEWAGRIPISFAFPTATATGRALIDLLRSGELPDGWRSTGHALLLGYGMALVTGVPLGLLMGLVPPLGRIARVYLEVLIVMPMAALVPLVILTMGVNIRASATIVFIFSMPFVAINAYGGMRDVDPVLIEMARAFNARWFHIVRAIVLPGALPMILAGARYGLARAFIGLVVAELLLSPFGVGHLIMDTRSTFEFDKMFATVLSMLLVAVMLLSGAQHLESRVLRWRRRGEEGGLQ